MKTHKSVSVLCILGLAATVACKVDSKNDSNKGSGKAVGDLDALKNQNALDLTGINIEASENTDVGDEKDLISEFTYLEPPRLNYTYENKGKDDEKSDVLGKEFNACYNKAMGKGSKVTYVESGILFAGKSDLSDCFKKYWVQQIESDGETKIEILEAKVTSSMQVIAVCPGGDVASFKNMSAEEIFSSNQDKSDFCKKATSKHWASQWSMNTLLKTKTTTAAKNGIPAAENISIIHTSMDTIEGTKDGKPCVTKREGTVVRHTSGCMKRERAKHFDDHTDSEDKGKTRISIFETLEGLESEYKDPLPSWYAKGPIKFFHKGWSGQVEYKGSESKPKLTATQGDKKIEKELDTKTYIQLNLDDNNAAAKFKLPKLPKLF